MFLQLNQHAMVFTQAAYERKDWDACSRLVPAIKVPLHCAAGAAAMPLTAAILVMYSATPARPDDTILSCSQLQLAEGQARGLPQEQLLPVARELWQASALAARRLTRCCFAVASTPRQTTDRFDWCLQERCWSWQSK